MRLDVSQKDSLAVATSARSDSGEGLEKRMRAHHTGNPHRKSDVSMHSILVVSLCIACHRFISVEKGSPRGRTSALKHL